MIMGLPGRFIRGYAIDIHQNTQPTTSLAQTIEAMVHRGPDFLEIPPNTGTSTVSVDEGEISSKSAENSITEIVEDNYTLPPSRGSIIEYYTWGKPSKTVGIVVRDVQSKFNENYNTVVVLTSENELEFVSGQQVTFHWHQVVDSGWLACEAIMENRFNTEFPLRKRAVAITRSFIKGLETISSQLSYEVERTYAQYAQSHQAVAVGLVQILESCKLPESVLPLLWKSYWHQQLVIGGLYRAVCRSSSWVVPSSVVFGPLSAWHETNCGSRGCSNEVMKRPVFLANSVENTAAIATLKCDLQQEEALKSYQNFIKTTVNNLPETNRVSHLTAWFGIWDGKQFQPLLTALKLVAIYPHPEVSAMLSQLEPFSDGTQASVLQFLRSIGLYSDKTDMWRSASMGGPLANMAIVVDRNQKQIQQTNTKVVVDDLNDKFRHLRQKHRFGDATPIFVVSPGVGVSLEKVNSRNYRVNIHVPDVMARLCPNSDEFDSILGVESSSVSEVLTRFKLHFQAQGQSEGVDYMAAHQLWQQKPQSPTQATCMTLSLAYNTYESNPFKDVENKAEVTLDTLGAATIKMLSKTELEECLAGKLEPSPLRLFRPRDPQPRKLSPSDCHDLRFIYSVLQTHFKTRNHQGALMVEPPLEGINERSNLFIAEVDQLASTIASSFAQRNQVAMVYQTQQILDSLSSDSVVVSHHNNQFLPQYSAQSFYQTLLARDHRGYVSKPAEVIGNQFLASPRLSVVGGMHQRYGSSGGYCAITQGQAVAVLLNQLQLVYTVHHNFLRGNTTKRHYTYLRGYGYRQSAMSVRMVSALLAQVQRCHDQIEAGKRAKRSSMVEVDEVGGGSEVVITHGGQYLRELDHRVSMGYHLRMGHEVMVLTKNDVIHQLGGVVEVEEAYRDRFGRFTVFVEVE
ncbi:hypothetical protein DIURU_001822 [Diutina rugosa]|uniref:Uncharacterized protein n=1 Tax=Diutina rugosa TaxID=5481 RepID=A0A642UST1_DIURU|nr:uncharacterized protein DIURU_001822 [Diutina rugosa]KAA8904746.1 hypothetical protein DIURU_001822 [Diutina rugosa]